MGREVRRVPPNWQHPKTKDGHYQPQHDENFDEHFAKWLSDFDRIRRGDLDEIERECYAKPGMNPLVQWLNDEGYVPDPAYYHTFRDEDATWWQVYENVTEGTPVTPPFATREELVDQLVRDGWDRKRAERFVSEGYAPTFVMTLRDP